MANLHLVPEDLRDTYEWHEFRNGLAILSGAYPDEWADICDVLRDFYFTTDEVLAGGGNKSIMARRLDDSFARRGWEERSFDVRIRVDDREYATPTHKVDYFKNGVAVEVEWNNKDPFFDRDLNNFRLLFDLRVIGVGVIITKSNELVDIFKGLGKDIWEKYGTTTTWMPKLLPRIDGGGGGGCPIVVIGITANQYRAS